MLQPRTLISILVSCLALAVILLGARQLVHSHQQALIAAAQRKMRDPAYRVAQTLKLQPSVEKEVTDHYPRATITPHGQVTDGANVYEVHLPPGEERELPFLYAEMCRICGKYRQQGYRGTLLLYDKDRIIKSVSLR